MGAYVIAEIGSNHNGDMGLCRRMIDAAKQAGADAAKFQSFTDKSLISEAEYQRRTQYGDSEKDKKRHFGTLRKMVEAYWLRPEQHHEMAEYCKEIKIDFLSTPFSPGEVDLLKDIGVDRYKIASMDVNHLVLLKYIARQGKPIILSTGMSTLGEIERAVVTLESEGSNNITILHCTSVYPPEPEYINLRNIPMLTEAFGYPVGYSDHSLGTDVPLIALSLGACIIEKHFTTDKELPGWDHWISADPLEMKQIAQFAKMSKEELMERAKKVPHYETILGSSRRILSKAEKGKIKVMRRCIVAAHDMKAGHPVTLADLDFKRPGTGIRPDQAEYILGRTLKRDVIYDHEFQWDDFGEIAEQAVPAGNESHKALF